MKVRRVRAVAQGIDDQEIELVEFHSGLLGDLIAVRDESEGSYAISKAETGHAAPSVTDFKWCDIEATDLKITDDRVGSDLRKATADILCFEDIIEDTTQLTPRDLARVDGDGAILEIDGSDIVESEDVVCVTMSDQQGLDAPETAAERLLPEIRRDIDQQPMAVMVDEKPGAKAFIPWIV